MLGKISKTNISGHIMNKLSRFTKHLYFTAFGHLEVNITKTYI